MSLSVVARNGNPCCSSTKSGNTWNKIYCRTSPSNHNVTLETKFGNHGHEVSHSRRDRDATETILFPLPISESCTNTACGEQVQERHRKTETKPRKHWSKIYDKSFHFMHWVKPNSAALMDKVSKVPLSHIV